MNKIFNILFSLGILAMVSCQSEELQPSIAAGSFLEIVTSTEHDTRTVLHENGKSVVWNDGDAIAVYDYASEKRQFIAEVREGKTTFKGNISPKHSSFCAVYPYALAASEATVKSAISVTLPSEQTAVLGSFGSDLNISIAIGERNVDGSPSQVQFRNVCQLFKLQIPSYINNRIAKIVLSAEQIIAGDMLVNYAGKDPVVTVAEQGATSVTLLPPTGSAAFAEGTYYFVLAPVQVNGFILTLTDTAGKEYSQHSSSTIGGSRGMIYTLGNLDLIEVPRATSVLVYSSGVLQGTDVTLSAPVSDKAWSATIKNAQGTVVRTISSATGSLKSEHTDASWPYLPKGTYTVDYNYLTANGKQMRGSTSFNITDNPTFGVSQAAASSYTYYAGDGVEKNVNRANALDAYTVTAISTSVTGISSKILENSNYQVTYTNDFSGSITASSNSTVTYADRKYSSTGAYTLGATATFDGVTKSGSKNIHITGLPYTAAPPTDAEWDGDANNWNYSKNDHVGVRVYGKEISKSFNIPADINVNVEHDVDVHASTISTTYNLLVSGNSICEITTQGKAASENCNNDTGTYPGTLLVSNPKVTLKNSYGNAPFFETYGTHLLVRKVIVRYR